MGGAAAMSPLSHGGGSPHPRPAAASDDSGGKHPASSRGFPLGNDGSPEKTGGHATDSPGPLHETMSVSTMSSSTTAKPTAMPKGGGGGRGSGGREPGGSVGVGGGPPGGSGSGSGSGTSSLAVAATVQIAAKTLVSKTINRKHGRTTSGAVVLKAAAWGIEPRLALDKKTHAALQQDSAGAGAGAGTAAATGGGRGGGRQFLKFEAWSTRACASSSPWAAHPTLRRQASWRCFYRVFFSCCVQTTTASKLY